MQTNTVEQAKNFFRTYAETTMPLHAALVRACCAEPDLPEDLALILEDIGQAGIFQLRGHIIPCGAGKVMQDLSNVGGAHVVEFREDFRRCISRTRTGDG